MNPNVPHFLRFARVVALASCTAMTACGGSVEGAPVADAAADTAYDGYTTGVTDAPYDGRTTGIDAPVDTTEPYDGIAVGVAPEYDTGVYDGYTTGIDAGPSDAPADTMPEAMGGPGVPPEMPADFA